MPHLMPAWFGSSITAGGQWVDMCSTPYNCTPGQDITTPLQNAINTANTNNKDATIFFSKPGVYNLNGPVRTGVSGTTPTQPYQGQILLPARSFAQGSISIRIMGLSPPSVYNAPGGTTNEPPPVGGTVLLSNVTTPVVSTTTTSALTAGATYSSIAVNATSTVIPKDASIVTVSGSSAQVWVTSAQVAAGATAIPVYGQQAEVTFTTGSAVNFGGFMFDAIAGAYFGAGTPSTNIRLSFENIILRAPQNPNVGAVNGQNVATLQFQGTTSVEVAGSNLVGITGCGVGVVFPPFDNIAIAAQSGTMQVYGYAVGVAHSEHFACEYLLVSWSLNGIQPLSMGGNGHASVYKKLLLQGNWNAIAAIGGNAMVTGFIDVDDGAGGYYAKPNWILKDPNNYLFGELKICQYANTGSPGFPVLGGSWVRWVPFNGLPSQWPSDNFTRMTYTNSQNYIGTTAQTHHKWYHTNPNSQEAFFTVPVNGPMQTNTIASGNVPAVVCRYQSGRAQPSRVIRVVATPTGAYYFFIICGARTTNAQYSTYALINGGRVQIEKITNGSGTAIAASPATVITAGTQYTFDIVISAPPNGPTIFTPLVNNVPVITSVTGAGTLEQAAAFLSAATGTAAITSLSVFPLTRPIPSGATLTIGTQTATTSAAVVAGATAIPITSFTPSVSYGIGTTVMYPTGGYVLAASEVSNYADAASVTVTQDGLGFWQDNATTVASFSVSPS